MINGRPDQLRKEDWIVKDASLATGQELVRQFHYSRGGSNTRTYMHGLFLRDAPNECLGITWWIPPTMSAAKATFPDYPNGVLCLSRLVLVEGLPKNSATFLLARSVRLIDRKRWPCLVTYADEWQGHRGTIYKAMGWDYAGKTKPERTYVQDGRMVSRKAGPKTRTHSEMLEMGAEMIGAFSKHKFVDIKKGAVTNRPL